jgi:hypothetical protein
VHQRGRNGGVGQSSLRGGENGGGSDFGGADALRWSEWTGGHRGEVGASARGHAERETVRRGKGGDGGARPFLKWYGDRRMEVGGIGVGRRLVSGGGGD